MLDWWREAGVDYAFDDAPRPWLAPPKAEETAARPAALAASAPAPPPPPLPQIGGPRESWPGDLGGFRDWWMSEPSLDHGQVHARVPPRGEAGARLMIVVPHPEPGDSDALLTGAEGRLLAAFLAAAGYPAKSVYLASALPRCMPHPDWEALASEGMGQVLAHHVRLVGPERLLVFGSTIPPLLSHPPAQNVPDLSLANHGETTPPTFVGDELGILLARPVRKRTLWQRWLEWTMDESGGQQ